MFCYFCCTCLVCIFNACLNELYFVIRKKTNWNSFKRKIEKTKLNKKHFLLSRLFQRYSCLFSIACNIPVNFVIPATMYICACACARVRACVPV